MTSEGCQLTRLHPAQPPGPILRIQHDRVALLVQRWMFVLDMEDLAAEVEALGQEGRERRGEGVAPPAIVLGEDGYELSGH
ncbi:MAG: hypothetical protein JSR66_02660 [Proteobacteria bacterium]|nr:hypothetical protein [Pseudomonadota bacterium]